MKTQSVLLSPLICFVFAAFTLNVVGYSESAHIRSGERSEEGQAGGDGDSDSRNHRGGRHAGDNTSAALERSKVTVASYNIAGFNICKGEAGFSLDAQAAVLNKMKPDIICFQEVVKDALGQGRHYPNEDRVARMAEWVGLKHTMFSKPPDDDLRWPPLHMRYGLSIISRWPLTDMATYKFRHLTDDDPGYPRLLLTAVVHPDNGLPKFRIATVHLMHNGPSGGGRNDRVIMAKFIKTKFKNEPMPMIMGGDYNSKDGSKEMQMLLSGGGWVNATPDFGIDKILYRLSEDWEVTETKTIVSPASDHNPIQATFKHTAPQ